jgi:flagellar biosynthetic protein FliQ
MTPETVIDILREALWMIVLLSSLIIGPSLVIGLVVSTFQAATQIN